MPDDLTLPDWLDVEAWEDWCEWRRLVADKRRPWNVVVWRRGLARLKRLHAKGWDADQIVEIIDKTIAAGWMGFYPPSDETPRRTRETTVTDLRLVTQTPETAQQGIRAAREALKR